MFSYKSSTFSRTNSKAQFDNGASLPYYILLWDLIKKMDLNSFLYLYLLFCKVWGIFYKIAIREL